LILQLEASLLTKKFKLYHEIIDEIEKLKRENFTIFNEAVILLNECWFYAMNDNLKIFKDKFKKFLNMSIEFEYENYITFRLSANNMNYV
jgi:hypothetical protein